MFPKEPFPFLVFKLLLSSIDWVSKNDKPLNFISIFWRMHSLSMRCLQFVSVIYYKCWVIQRSGLNSWKPVKVYLFYNDWLSKNDKVTQLHFNIFSNALSVQEMSSVCHYYIWVIQSFVFFVWFVLLESSKSLFIL